MRVLTSPNSPGVPTDHRPPSVVYVGTTACTVPAQNVLMPLPGCIGRKVVFLPLEVYIKWAGMQMQEGDFVRSPRTKPVPKLRHGLIKGCRGLPRPVQPEAAARPAKAIRDTRPMIVPGKPAAGGDGSAAHAPGRRSPSPRRGNGPHPPPRKSPGLKLSDTTHVLRPNPKHSRGSVKKCGPSGGGGVCKCSPAKWLRRC
jgi:hypothetical protein